MCKNLVLLLMLDIIAYNSMLGTSFYCGQTHPFARTKLVYGLFSMDICTKDGNFCIHV
jgi:hypothetical protein